MMRWIVCWSPKPRILVRGGVFLYPADNSPGYRDDVCGCRTKRIPWHWSWNGRAAQQRQALANSGTRGNVATPAISLTWGRCVCDVAAIHEGIEPMFTIAMRRVRAAWPVSLNGSDVAQLSHHIDHGFIGSRHDVVKKTSRISSAAKRSPQPISKVMPFIATNRAEMHADA
jgi:hypothetical protein